MDNLVLTSHKSWLITGVAGFIGSKLLEMLLLHDQSVLGVDNFSTGFRLNLDKARKLVHDSQWSRFTLVKGDIRDYETCRSVCQGMDIVLHQAAVASVPLSLENPALTHDVNVTGFLNMLLAAREARVHRFVYASSSSVYGDDQLLPKREESIGRPLSPYAASKYLNEVYAELFSRVYGMQTIGLRYFNIFGPRQDPHGAYAAVIPHWIDAMFANNPVVINGDGETTRDFCPVGNVVHANVLAGTIENPEAMNQVYNIGTGHPTTLNDLYYRISTQVKKVRPCVTPLPPVYAGFRSGDIRASVADISKSAKLLGYDPQIPMNKGLFDTIRDCLPAVGSS
jgi:UDP-N-acetylglucosamine/UDP-N-acetylgalactosamine 4-epimerase